MVGPLIKSLAARAGFAIFKVRNRYAQDGLFTVHSDHFRRDPGFRAAYQRGILASQGVDPEIEWRIHIGLWAARTALLAEGDFVECGVNAGFFSSAIMQKLDWDVLGRRFYLIDTFRGPVLDQYSAEEVRDGRLALAQQTIRAGAYVTDIDRVRANFAGWRNVVILQGAIPDVLRATDFGTIAFVHIDLNCALPERAAFEFFWDRLSRGGVVLLDDYGYYRHDRQREAIHEAACARGVEVLSLPTGQGVLIR